MKTPRAALLKSLSALSTEYLDLYLIHWPVVSRKPANSPQHKKLRIEAWKALNEAKLERLVHHIGVSNFTPQHIRELMEETEYGIQGAFVQMEINPWYWRDAAEIQATYQDQSITIVGYALLAEGKLLGEDSTNILDETSARSGLTKVQVVLCWALRKQWVVLARSENVTHLQQNLDASSLIGSLDEEDCIKIDQLSSVGGEEKRCWDPRLVV